MEQNKDKNKADKDCCNKSSSATNQFYHSSSSKYQDTDSYSIGDGDSRFRPLLIENLKNRIAQGKFRISRDEVLRIIKQAADEAEESDADENEKDEAAE